MKKIHEPSWNKFSLNFIKKGLKFTLLHVSMSWIILPSLRTLILRMCGIKFKDRKSVFVGTNVLFDLSGEIFIGKNVTITTGTKIMTHYFDPVKRNYRLGKVIIKNNVFIGMNTLIVNDVTLGQNSIIAAGSVVTKDIPNKVISGGIPAKIIKQL